MKAITTTTKTTGEVRESYLQIYRDIFKCRNSVTIINHQQKQENMTFSKGKKKLTETAPESTDGNFSRLHRSF